MALCTQPPSGFTFLACRNSHISKRLYMQVNNSSRLGSTESVIYKQAIVFADRWSGRPFATSQSLRACTSSLGLNYGFKSDRYVVPRMKVDDEICEACNCVLTLSAHAEPPLLSE